MDTIKIRFLAELLESGYLDIDFFFKILEKCEENNLYLDTQEVLSSYGGYHINHFIAESLYLLVEGFLKKYKTQIENILNIQDLDRYREENELYETFINLLDSHLWFHNDKIELLFENSEFYYL